jgi:hypothetical protein
LGWTVDWQRLYVGLGALLEAGAALEEIVPGVTHRGDDIGRWLASQTRDWARLNEEQQRRLDELGVRPAVRAQKASARTSVKTAGVGEGCDAFTRGVAALQQYIQREGKTMVGRQHVEQLPDGTSVRLGVWLSNQKSRRDRLSEQQLAALANLGYTWAA